MSVPMNPVEVEVDSVSVRGIVVGSARHSPPASTKTPVRTLCAQLRLIPVRRWIPAFGEHRAALAALFLIRSGVSCVLWMELLVVREVS